MIGLEDISREFLPQLYRANILSVAELPLYKYPVNLKIYIEAGFDAIIIDPEIADKVTEEFTLIAWVYHPLCKRDINLEMAELACRKCRFFEAFYSISSLPTKIEQIISGCNKLLIAPNGDVALIEIGVNTSREEIARLIELALSYGYTKASRH